MRKLTNIVMSVTLVIVVGLPMVEATTISLNVADGNWTNAASWNPEQIPVAGDDARSYNGGTIRVTSDVACDNLLPGQAGTGINTLDIVPGASITASDYFIIGQYGHGVVTQSGGTINCGNVRFAQNSSTAVGEYMLTGGSLICSGSMDLPQSGTGTLIQTDGVIDLGSNIATLAGNEGTYGRYDISGGSFTGRLFVARKGLGYMKQSGGTVYIKTGMVIANTDTTGTGTYEIVSGELIVETGIGLGGAGNGTILFGDAYTTGSITNSGNRSLGVGKIDFDGTGLFRGWGVVGLTGRLKLYANGIVMADGYGIERTLDLSSMDVTMNTYTDEGKAGAFYAQNHGKLLFPSRNLAAYTYYFGESSESKTTNVVNSAVVKINSLSASTSLSCAILATDRDDVNEKAKLAGVWEFDVENPSYVTSAEISFRYDDLAVANLNLEESELQLMRPDDDGWKSIPATVDVARNIITSDILTNINGQFAVGSRTKGTFIIVK